MKNQSCFPRLHTSTLVRAAEMAARQFIMHSTERQNEVHVSSPTLHTFIFPTIAAGFVQYFASKYLGKRSHWGKAHVWKGSITSTQTFLNCRGGKIGAIGCSNPVFPNKQNTLLLSSIFLPLLRFLPSYLPRFPLFSTPFPFHCMSCYSPSGILPPLEITAFCVVETNYGRHVLNVRNFRL